MIMNDSIQEWMNIADPYVYFSIIVQGETVLVVEVAPDPLFRPRVNKHST